MQCSTYLCPRLHGSHLTVKKYIFILVAIENDRERWSHFWPYWPTPDTEFVKTAKTPRRVVPETLRGVVFTFRIEHRLYQHCIPNVNAQNEYLQIFLHPSKFCVLIKFTMFEINQNTTFPNSYQIYLRRYPLKSWSFF